LILIIDNYDSFTYNLVDLVARHAPVTTSRNDQITLSEIEKMDLKGILLSPGPGRPQDGGISLRTVQHFSDKLPILGVCLGHQIIGEVFGAQIIHAAIPMHGKTDQLSHDHQSIFEGLPDPLQVMRYHSLLIDSQSLPHSLIPTAYTPQGEIMGIRHEKYPIEGVQFHPESILSQGGNRLIANWVNRICS